MTSARRAQPQGPSVRLFWRARGWPNRPGVLGVWFPNLSGLARARRPKDSTLTRESQIVWISAKSAEISTLKMVFPPSQHRRKVPTFYSSAPIMILSRGFALGAIWSVGSCRYLKERGEKYFSEILI